MKDTLNHGITSEIKREAHTEKEGNNQGKMKKISPNPLSLL